MLMPSILFEAAPVGWEAAPEADPEGRTEPEPPEPEAAELPPPPLVGVTAAPPWLPTFGWKYVEAAEVTKVAVVLDDVST